MHHVDHLTVTGGNHTAFDQVLQLTNIAGKPISEQRVDQPRAEPRQLTPMAQAEMAQKITHQQRDIFATFPQRWQMNGKNIQSVEQVFTKTPGLNLATQIQVSRRDNPYIHADRRRTTDSLDLTFLQGSQNLALRTEAQGRNFVEEQRPAMGSLETPGPRTLGASEAPPLDTEQFGLHQILRQGRAVERHKRHMLPGTRLVQRSGE